MTTRKYPVTRDGLVRLTEELKRLQEVERPRIIAAVAEARSHGDLRENAAYDAARHDQAMLEKKIVELEAMLKNHEIIESDGDSHVVRLGSKVTVDIDGDEEEYRIVGALEAKPAAGLISNESPVGKALLGLHEGQEATVATPRGAHVYRILKVEA